MESATADANRFRAAGYAVLLAGAAILPLPLASLDLPVVGHTDPDRTPFELLALTGSAVLLAIGALELRRRSYTDAREYLVLLLPLLVGLHALLLVVEFSEPRYDYQNYVAAAKAVQAGETPYGLRPPWYFLYPPLLAYGLAFAHDAVTAAGELVGARIHPRAAWEHVFFLYQGAQLLLIAGAFFLCRAFSRRLGVREPVASLLVAGLLVVNSPMVRALQWGQINLWVLDLLLLAVLGLASRPFLAGLAAGLGAHLKIYPLVLLAPWTLTRQWRGVAGIGVGLVGVAALVASFGRDWRIWREFLAFAPDFPPGTFFRDNGLHSLVHNTLRVAERVTGLGVSAIGVNVVTAGLTALVLAALAVRFFRRERELAPGSGSPSESEGTAFFRFAGHAMDGTAGVLIAGPVVWEHHYVMAIPVWLWAAAGWGAARPVALATAAILIFGLPTFDVFPLSYHRLAGLALLLFITRASPPRLRDRSPPRAPPGS